MKILVTGSKGFVGSHLVPYLKKKGHKVSEWDLTQSDDIFDDDFLDVVRWCDVIVHLAAQVSVNKSFDKPTETMFTNVLGTAHVCRLAAQYDKKLIYPSSAAVYHRELSPYAESKALGEDICKRLQEAGQPITILRFFNIYGDNMNPDSGSVMYQFLEGTKNGEIVIFGDGEQTRDWINIKDIVSIIEKALSPKWNGAIVDCGTGEAYSLNYVVGAFKFYSELYLNKSFKIKHEKPRREIRWSMADTSTLKRLYKKKLVTNLNRDIAHLVHDLK